MVMAIVFSSFAYPMVTKWAWSSDGWLAHDVHYIDFAGSGVVHVFGGATAIVACVMIGPRIGRFEGGKSIPMPGHSVVLVSLGWFFLIIGFFAFNCGSLLGITGPGFNTGNATAVVVSTMLSSSAAGLVAFFITKLGVGRAPVGCLKYKIDILHPLGGYWSLCVLTNGSLSGAIAICAGGGYVAPWAAVVIGVGAGLFYSMFAKFMEECRIDDPMQTPAVHMIPGWWGVIATALFALPHEAPHYTNGGVIYAWDALSFTWLGTQVMGGLLIMVWAGLITFVVVLVLMFFGEYRISPEQEREGLDFLAGEPAYPMDLSMFQG